MDKIVKTFRGHSGSDIVLIEKDDSLIVRKTGNVERNFLRLSALKSSGFNVPQIYAYDRVDLYMEYIHGLDMATFLKYGEVNALSDFLIETLKQFSDDAVVYDYTSVYEKKLEWIDKEELPFSKQEFIDSLPKFLPKSNYHGDLTLENIIYSDTEGFRMIDAVEIEYDSFVFDIAKLRQDLHCKWFIRDTKSKLDVKLSHIEQNILSEFPIARDDNLLIAMLLRVFLHTKTGDKEYEFLMKEIQKLWK